MEYNIIEAKSVNKLIRDVTDAIGEGWIPQGGATNGGDGYGYFQAMIRHQPTPTKHA